MRPITFIAIVVILFLLIMDISLIKISSDMEREFEVYHAKHGKGSHEKEHRTLDTEDAEECRIYTDGSWEDDEY